ncbi:hypothetical protein DFH06DRAFT_1467642 [Mycena polygramma]|nr:hypothetical protein DFH06DRAFT_1467642 [Mycena polygramma]
MKSATPALPGRHLRPIPAPTTACGRYGYFFRTLLELICSGSLRLMWDGGAAMEDGGAMSLGRTVMRRLRRAHCFALTVLAEVERSHGDGASVCIAYLVFPVPPIDSNPCPQNYKQLKVTVRNSTDPCASVSSILHPPVRSFSFPHPFSHTSPLRCHLPFSPFLVLELYAPNRDGNLNLEANSPTEAYPALVDARAPAIRTTHASRFSTQFLSPDRCFIVADMTPSCITRAAAGARKHIPVKHASAVIFLVRYRARADQIWTESMALPAILLDPTNPHRPSIAIIHQSKTSATITPSCRFPSKPHCKYQARFLLQLHLPPAYLDRCKPYICAPSRVLVGHHTAARTSRTIFVPTDYS